MSYIDLYVDNCPECDHWRDYSLVDISKNGTLTFRCPICKTTKTLTYNDLKALITENNGAEDDKNER